MIIKTLIITIKVDVLNGDTQFLTSVDPTILPLTNCGYSVSRATPKIIIMVEDLRENMKGVPLLFLRNFVRELIPCSYRNFRWICLVALLFQVPVECFTLYRVLKCGTQYRFCVVGLMVHMPGMICLLATFYIEFQMDRIERVAYKNSFSLDSVSKKVSSVLSNESRKMKKFCIVVTIAGVLSYVSNYPLNEEERTFLCTKWILEEHFGSYHGLFLLTTLFAKVMNALAVINIQCISMFICQLLRFQLIHIREHVDNMKHSEKKDGHDNAIYEIFVFENISFIVKQHNKIKKLQKILLSPFEKYVALGVPLVAEIMIVCLMYLVATKSTALGMSRTIVATINSSLLIANMFVSGQYLIDESENLHRSICELPWENWNKKNREALLVILPITARPMKATYYGLCELSYASVLSVVKLGYSLMTIAIQLK